MMLVTLVTSDSQLPAGSSALIGVPLTFDERPRFFSLASPAGESKAADAERLPDLPFVFDPGGSGGPPILL